MKTKLGHIVFSVETSNMAFYRDLFAFLGWDAIYDSPEMLGVGSFGDVTIWFGAATKDSANDYDAPGMNHIAIAAESVADVDASVAYLRERAIEALFDTPQHRADFAGGEDQTYYQVMFESPDRVLFEVVYTGPK